MSKGHHGHGHGGCCCQGHQHGKDAGGKHASKRGGDDADEDQRGNGNGRGRAQQPAQGWYYFGGEAPEGQPPVARTAGEPAVAPEAG